MKKRIKKIMKILTVFSVLCSFLLFSCTQDPGNLEDNTEKNENLDDESEKKEENLSTLVKSGLKFDFSNAKAIAAVDKDSLSRAAYSRNARALEDSSIDDSPLLKILEDGSFESAITLAENANLATIRAIYKSPLKD